MRTLTFENQRSNGPQVHFVGDSETGLVHRAGAEGCDVETYAVFIDVRTALVHGYELCPHCIAAPRSAAPLSARKPLARRA